MSSIQPDPSWDPPEDQVLRVVVTTDSGEVVHEWQGYCDNASEAHYKSLEAWDEFYRAKRGL